MGRPLALLSLLLAVVGCAKGLNAPSNGGAGGQSVVQTTGVGSGTTANTVGNGTATIGSTVAATTDTTVTTDATTTADATTTVGSTTVATTGVTTSAATTVTTGSGTCALDAMNAMGCPSCSGACPVTWPLSWDPTPGATYYMVSYQCLALHSYQTMNTTADLCNEVGMCNDSGCAFGAGPVYVQACDGSCCGPKVQFNLNDTPIACGGGVCC